MSLKNFKIHYVFVDNKDSFITFVRLNQNTLFLGVCFPVQTLLTFKKPVILEHY